MPSKMVLDRQNVLKTALNEAEVQLPAVLHKLNHRLGSFLQPGESLPDIALLFQLFARLLRDSGQKMADTDDVHLAELLDDGLVRRNRFEAAEILMGELDAIRSVARQVFEADAETSVLGIEDALPSDPQALLQQAEITSARLRSPALQLPPSKVLGVRIDPVSWAERLEAPTMELRQAIEMVQVEAREAAQTFGSKLSARESFDKDFAHTQEIWNQLKAWIGTAVDASKY